MIGDHRIVKSYAQYCPIARTSEILSQRWMPVILRDLLNGPSTYSRLADGAPGLSRSLLTSRLRQLERLALVERTEDSRYALTEPGRALSSVLQAMGAWGEEWLDVTTEQADPGYVLNSWVGTYLNESSLPEERVVAHFRFTDQPSLSDLWVIFSKDEPEVCRIHPGFEVDLVVVAESVALAEWHLGRIEWRDAVAAGRIAVDGPSHLVRALPGWNRRSRWVGATHPH